MDEAELRKALLLIVADIGFEERNGIPDDAGFVERIMELVNDYTHTRSAMLWRVRAAEAGDFLTVDLTPPIE